MCGRYSLGVDTDRLIAEFGLAVLTASHEPRYNIAPGQDVPAVVAGPEGLRLGTLRWGFAPSRGRRTLINARSETVHRTSAFAASFRERRCWIPADGFYEWRTEPDGSRQPYHVRLPDGRPFVLAGLWTRGEDPGAPHTCAILTTEPAPALREIHDRMPVILPEEVRRLWLDADADPASLHDLLRPFPGELVVRRVSDRVNSTTADDPSCVVPLEPTA